MKGSVKLLSIILILASLFGLVGGGIGLKDVMDCKAYWEDKGAKSDADLTTLEDGLNTLKENEQAYLDGLAAYEAGSKDYEQGKKDLADGQKEYDAGLKTLEEKQAEYNKGVNDLKAAESKLAAGRKTLEENQDAYVAGKTAIKAGEPQLEAARIQIAENEAKLANAKTLLDGIAAIDDGFNNPTEGWHAGYTGLQTFYANMIKAGNAFNVPAASNVAEYDAAIANAKAGLEQVSNGYKALHGAEQKKAQLTEQKTQLEAAGDTSSDTYQSVVDGITQCDTLIAGINAQLAGKPTEAEVNQQLPLLTMLQENNVPTAVKNGQQTLAAGVAQAVSGIMSDRTLAAKLVSASGMSQQQLIATVNALPTMDYASFDATMQQLLAVSAGLVNGDNGLKATYENGLVALEAGKKEFAQKEAELNAGKAKIAEYEKGLAEYNAGLDQYYAGKNKLTNGKVQLDEGKEKLDTASKTISEGKKTLSDAEKQLAEGKAKLEEFESGRDQVIAGIETVLASETHGKLVSIADRLGPDYKYVDDKGNLDIDQGLAAVATAREFSADNSAAVTKELTTRAVAAVLALIAGVVALVAGILGLMSVCKVAGILSLVAAVAAVAAAVAAGVAGSVMSVVAGSGVAAITIAAGAVVALVGAINAVVALKGAKAAA